ncbi:hypothetical protein [Amycolatopsis sp. PS_44_ISF1]|uniref:hypothetical protein n=1 Tax=Amycolatopsis sp. PS_44_ISF1 TaxID=2974917 RepID=UPI0028E049EB|nr:hypothetical protein [Amycolatopsis sp. PS_44_ISF1]MDT8915815.1 hypothetical protein [Amycolatopsis sp. PS_44_ISF1]
MTAPSVPIKFVDPTEVRKVAAFVEALAELESRFGFTLDDGPGGIRLGGKGLATGYTVARRSSRSPLTLALEMPPVQVPTVADVAAAPEYWISGPGREIASRTLCPHDYALTDSCPGCHCDKEKAENEGSRP